MSTFQCQHCGRSFNVPQATLDKYPSWQPKTCLRCRSPSGSLAGSGSSGRKTGSTPRRVPAAARGEAVEGTLTLQEVLATSTHGPTTGVFTYGAAHPNPGAGGW